MFLGRRLVNYKTLPCLIRFDSARHVRLSRRHFDRLNAGPNGDLKYFTRIEGFPENRGAGAVRPRTPVFRASSNCLVIS